ncbi:hypothetical protein BDM02DRAFT_3270255 [Thelephora ganbajun]|uniref:Uncharacterized protein n=1 Tax=Thelephora ganbajun TaxID=370292 RepID=A0ACB6ZCP5_THEGA|nr:hypothetical protein BDM02DRAFT_3270255 [Thelephora ganbajun]
MSSPRGSSGFFLVPLHNPYDRDEQTESRVFTEDDSYRPLIATPTQDHAMELNGSDRNSSQTGSGGRSGGRGDGNGGVGLRPPRMPPPRRWTSGKARQSRLFERPKWGHLCLHAFLCIAGYPLIYVGTILARDKTLFWARLIVGLWCATVGVVIGWSLLAYASRFLEAATWATIIHLSHGNGDSGMKLKDLARNADESTSVAGGLLLLLRRTTSRGTRRNVRKSYDARPWSLVIIYFFTLVAVAACLPFALGRVIDIGARLENQRLLYREVEVSGDLSPDDITRASAQLGSFMSYVRTWTLAPFAGRSQASAAVQMHWVNDDVYFGELTIAELTPGGHGQGTFNVNSSITISQPKVDDLFARSNNNTAISELIRMPRWGIRIHCEKLPDPQIYITPRTQSGLTYIYTPKSLIDKLFTSFSIPTPEKFKTTDLSSLGSTDTLPSNVKPDDVSYIAKFYDTGLGHSLHSINAHDGQQPGNGWTSVEIVLVRLNNSFVPPGQFPVFNEIPEIDAAGRETRIGYDAAVCVELYEPWIIEVFYNSNLGLVATVRIVDQANTIINVLGERNVGVELGEDITQVLNSTGKVSPFFVSHDNGVNQMLKDNGLDGRYTPSPTVVSFTDGAGPEGYTSLSASRFASVRALSDASNVLPFLSGSGKIVGHSYSSEILAGVKFVPWQLATMLGVPLLLGVVAAFFLPTLPLGVPRRGFGVFSWIAALQGQELMSDVTKEGVSKLEELEELEKILGEKRVHFSP